MTRLSGIRDKPPYFRSVGTRGERHDRLVVEPLRHPVTMLQGRAYYVLTETCVPRTMLGIPHAPLPTSRPLNNTICRALVLHNRGFPEY
jgi:hypothetical protein